MTAPQAVCAYGRWFISAVLCVFPATVHEILLSFFTASPAVAQPGPGRCLCRQLQLLSFHMTDVLSLFWGLPSSPNIELRLRPFNQEAASALLETLVACRRLNDDGRTVGSNKKKINGRRFTLRAAVVRAADIRGQCVILEELMAFSLWCFCRETMRSEQTRLKEVTLLTGGAAAGSSSNATNTAEIWTRTHSFTVQLC